MIFPIYTIGIKVNNEKKIYTFLKLSLEIFAALKYLQLSESKILLLIVKKITLWPGVNMSLMFIT